MSSVSDSDIRTIITDPHGAEKLVQTADRLGRELKDANLTTNQIRALYGEVRQIQGEWQSGGAARERALRRLILLKPKMAYRAGRDTGRQHPVAALVDVLRQAVDEVIREKDDPQKQSDYFEHFVEFFEAILAYHKSYGGRSS